MAKKTPPSERERAMISAVNAMSGLMMVPSEHGGLRTKEELTEILKAARYFQNELERAGIPVKEVATHLPQFGVVSTTYWAG